jgi:hypothetical protein
MKLAMKSVRAEALDALRGLAILAMVLSGTIRFKILPDWMYHAQLPPPDHIFNPDLRGLTWVDVVFPLFLFVMGAAIPLALSRRIEQGKTTAQMVLEILKRGFFLSSFAIILQHLRPLSIHPHPVALTWWIALAGFGLLCLIYGRMPHDWALKKYEIGLNGLGWILAIALFSQLQYDGGGFSLKRSDIILLLLANAAVFGSLIWLLTRFNLWLRLGSLGLLIALQLSATTDGWVKVVWLASPVPWLFQFEYLTYLFIVIPGTIVGDLILSWLQQSADEIDRIPMPWQQRRAGMQMFAMLTICLVLLIGLQARWIWQTVVVGGAIAGFSYFLFIKPNNSTETLLLKFYQWGIYWLLLGLFFEPYGGGIRKDPPAYSYYFITTAIALFLLITFTIFVDILHQKKWLWLLIDNGKNPMIAYVTFANVLLPILTLTGLEDQMIQYSNTPFMGFVKGILYTLFIALCVSSFTRLKLFWKT